VPALPAHLHAVDQRADVDLAAAQRAARDLLLALGADTESERLRDTPRRMAAMYAELLTPAVFAPTTFPNDGGYDELVVATGIRFHSLCEHHLLPFVGVAHVGYLPAGRIIGLSKLARIVDHCARALQVQERLTGQIADWLDRNLAPKGRRRARGRAHVHVAARGGEARRTHRHLGAARPRARRSPHPPGVPRPHRRPPCLTSPRS
jgi:GTP cyclohydrolase IA